MISSHPVQINFDNTQNAFLYKSDEDLKRSNFLFSSMGYGWLVSLGTRLTPWALRAGLPVKSLIRKTIFKQFVGGESLADTKQVVDMLGRHKVQVILDYGAEGGDDGEDGFDKSMQHFIEVIDYAGSQMNIPFMSIKVTGFASFNLLEKIDALMHQTQHSLINRYTNALSKLTIGERAEWQRVENRMRKICNEAAEKNIGVLVDAEESWIQDPVDALTCIMMDEFNKQHCVVYNTVQLYRHDRYAFLVAMLEAAKQRGFILGAKLVRGAYMEKERLRATEKNYDSPIQPNKEATDKDYNKAVSLCLQQLDKTAVIIATHNESSNMMAVKQMQEMNLELSHRHVHFSQLYGMSDNITFNLAMAGASVSKYLPFGPIDEVIPYLMRRAQENSSVNGQSSRELLLIRKELKRRGLR